MVRLQKILFSFGLICIFAQPASAGVVDGNVIMDQSMNENLCALTFDDGPSRNTPQLLDMLREYGIPCTFFLLGSQVAYNPDIVVRMLEEGHEIGNHSWSHPNLRLLSSDAQAEQIEQTDSLLRSLGATPLFFRPPYGSFDERTTRITDRLGVSLVLWSLDSRDWKHLPTDYAKLVSTRGTIYDDGALRGIFLFHDTHKSTVDDLPRIIAHLRAGGCQKFVTVSDYLAGILDHEPGMVLSRNRPPLLKKDEDFPPMYAAGSGPVPLARCSRPWSESERQAARLELREAHAQVSGESAGM